MGNNADQLRREHPIVFGRLYEAAARALDGFQPGGVIDDAAAIADLQHAVLRAKEWIYAAGKCE